MKPYIDPLIKEESKRTIERRTKWKVKGYMAGDAQGHV